MKKLFAILLVLAMVLPMCVATNAAESTAEKKPFVMVNTEDVGVTFDKLTYKIPVLERQFRKICDRGPHQGAAGFELQ